MKYLALIITILVINSSHSKNNKIKSFKNAKSILIQVYGVKGVTFYCSCPYQAKSIKTKKCIINSKKFKKRLSRLEWEHVVPAHAFGHSFVEWRDNKKICGRKNKKPKSPRACAKQNKEFSQMEADIYNLVPAVGSINAMRSKFSMASFIPKSQELCPGLYIENNKIMPPDHLRGDIARIYMYMDVTYPNRGVISNKNKKLFDAWDKLDPVDKKECDLVKRKQKYQKNENNIVLSRCKKLK